jgi:hypothetical protein
MASMADGRPEIQSPVQLIVIMLSDALEGIAETLPTMTPAQRTEMSRALRPALDNVEQTLALSGKFLAIRPDA